MAATDFVTESQIDSLTTTIAAAVKGNADDIAALDPIPTTAADIPIVDSAGDYTATDVEAALAEVKLVADSAAGGGVAINDAATNSTDAWSSSKIDTEITSAINAVLDGAPAALDTLNELAAALGDDAAFESTVTTALAARLRFDAAQTLTAPQKAQALTNLGVVASSQNFASDFTTGIA